MPILSVMKTNESNKKKIDEIHETSGLPGVLDEIFPQNRLRGITLICKKIQT